MEYGIEHASDKNSLIVVEELFTLLIARAYQRKVDFVKTIGWV